MITLIGTYETVQTAIVIPAPSFGDSENNQSTVDLKRSITGVPYTYVKNPSSKKLVYTIRMAREKAAELEAFVLAYFKYNIRMYNHKGECWRVKFINEAFDFQRTGRGEFVSATLEMEGTRIS